MFYNRAIKVSSSHNQSYTEIGSVYHRVHLSHILIVPPFRAYSGQGSVLFSSLVYFFYKTLFSIYFRGRCMQRLYSYYSVEGITYTLFNITLVPVSHILLPISEGISYSTIASSSPLKLLK